MSFSAKVKQQSREMLLGNIRTAMVADDAASYTLGAIIADMESEPGMLETFKSITVAELRGFFAVQTEKVRKQRETVADVPVADWENAKAAHKASVLAYLTEQGLGEGRGFTPHALRTALKGSEIQMRDQLKELVAEGKIVSTGETKGKKFVVTALKAKAEAALAAEKAAQEKAKQEKADRAAKGETPAKGRKPKAA